MDFTNLLEQYHCNACVLSVDTFEDGSYGNILVADGNQFFKDDIVELTKQSFVKDSPYYHSFPKDLNFEDFIYRCAVLHQPLHTYVNLYMMGLWVEMYLLPLNSDKENTGYCLYSYIISPKASEESMSDLSPETSAKVIAACIKFRSSDDFPKTVNEVSSDIRKICNAERCCILTINDEYESCSILGDTTLPGGTTYTIDEFAEKGLYKLALTWEDTLAGSTCLIIKNEQDMEVVKQRNPEWYESLMEVEVKSLILFPLKNKEKLLGYIWVTNFDTQNEVQIKETLEVITFFIGSEIANYQMLKRLEILGTIDMLTGSLNRNAMNNRVAKFDEEGDENVKTLGILFADLNGLKLTNDHSGHLAGDRLLKKAAALLRQVFVDDEIYRAGGDEFMVLALNNEWEEFQEKVARVRDLSESQAKVSFAVGSCFEERDIDIRRALRRADEDMYLDKKEYYTRHPELRHR